MLPVEAQAARVAPTNRACVKAADMPLSLKLPEGFIPSYWRNNRPGCDADVPGHAFGAVQQRLAFAHGDALLDGREGQQVVEPPYAAETMRIAAARPFLFELAQRLWHAEPIPVVRHVQQSAALGAGHEDLVDGVGRPAGARNTLLEGRAAAEEWCCSLQLLSPG